MRALFPHCADAADQVCLIHAIEDAAAAATLFNVEQHLDLLIHSVASATAFRRCGHRETIQTRIICKECDHGMAVVFAAAAYVVSVRFKLSELDAKLPK